jgi:hypothetical protein
MKTIFVPFAKKTRQLKGLSRKIRRWIADGTFQAFSQTKQKALLGKLRKLYHQVTAGKIFKTRQIGLSMSLIGGLALSTPVAAQNFLPPVSNPFGLSGSYSFPTLADLDNDGDLDIVALNYINGANTYVFVENTGVDNMPLFINEQANPFGLESYESITTFDFTDIDGDGDLDFFGGDYYGNGIAFQRNLGTPESPSFGDLEYNPFGFQSDEELTIPVFSDIDGDGDSDLFTSNYYGQVIFYENTGTPASPTFTSPVNNPFSLEPGTGIFLFDFADLDNDGDIDFMVSDLYGGPTGLIRYQENQGSPEAPSFATQVSWPFNIEIPKVDPYIILVLGDVDNDGDQDFISGGYESNILFFENTVMANTPPASDNALVVALQDQEYFFAAGDFPFTDPDPGQGLFAIQILNLPLNGVLKYNGNAINIGQFITNDNIPNFSFTPDPGEFGDNYAAFVFRVYDGTDYSPEDYTMSVNVTEVVSAGNILVRQLNTFPNPAKDIVHITGKWTGNNSVISLYDMQGTLVKRENLVAGSQEINHILQLGALTPGVYQWLVQDGENEASGKIVKQ